MSRVVLECRCAGGEKYAARLRRALVRRLGADQVASAGSCDVLVVVTGEGSAPRSKTPVVAARVGAPLGEVVDAVEKLLPAIRVEFRIDGEGPDYVASRPRQYWIGVSVLNPPKWAARVNYHLDEENPAPERFCESEAVAWTTTGGDYLLSATLLGQRVRRSVPGLLVSKALRQTYSSAPSPAIREAIRSIEGN